MCAAAAVDKAVWSGLRLPRLIYEAEKRGLRWGLIVVVRLLRWRGRAVGRALQGSWLPRLSRSSGQIDEDRRFAGGFLLCRRHVLRWLRARECPGQHSP